MAIRRRPESEPTDHGADEQVLTHARDTVARGDRLSHEDFLAIEAVQQVDSFEHLVLTMCLMTPAQEGDYRRHRVEAGDWGSGL